MGFGTIAVAEQIEMVELLREGKGHEANEIADRTVQPLEEVIFAAPVRDYRVRLKEALCELGVLESTDMRPPLLPLGEDERRVVREATRRAALRMPIRSS